MTKPNLGVAVSDTIPPDQSRPSLSSARQENKVSMRERILSSHTNNKSKM